MNETEFFYHLEISRLTCELLWMCQETCTCITWYWKNNKFCILRMTLIGFQAQDAETDGER